MIAPFKKGDIVIRTEKGHPFMPVGTICAVYENPEFNPVMNRWEMSVSFPGAHKPFRGICEKYKLFHTKPISPHYVGKFAKAKF